MTDALGSHEVAVDGGDLHVTVEGPPTGAPIILIGRLGMQAFEWSPPFIAALIAGGKRVIAFDPRGFGASTAPAPTSFGEMATDVMTIADDLELPTFSIFGSSMGGVVALDFAWRALRSSRVHHRLLAMTLFGSSAGDGELAAWHEAFAQVAATSPKGDAPDSDCADYLVRELEVLMGVDFDEISTQVRAKLAVKRGWSVAAVRATKRAAESSVTKRAIRDYSEMPEIPTSIIVGSEDKVLPVDQSERLKQLLPHATLTVIDGLGHEIGPTHATQVAAVTL